MTTEENYDSIESSNLPLQTKTSDGEVVAFDPKSSMNSRNCNMPLSKCEKWDKNGPSDVHVVQNKPKHDTKTELTIKALKEHLEKARESTYNEIEKQNRIEKSHKYEMGAMTDELSSN